MFEIKDKVEHVMEDVENIAKNYYKLTVVNAVDKGSKVGASLIINGLLVALGFFIFLFAGFGASYWIGQKLGSPMLGFFVVAGFLLLLLLIIIIFRKKSIQPLIRNIIIKNLYD